MKCYVTDKNNRLNEVHIETKAGSSGEMQQLKVYENITYQNFLGIGGALTEAAAFTYSKMSDAKKEEVVKAYFGQTGNNYNFCRLHIESCDFALGNYSYVDDPEDRELKTFSIDRDRQYIIPLVKAALDKNKDIKFLASPWSPPAFMKTNGEKNNGGKLKEEYRQMWAEMICKYIDEYAKEGINIERLTVQNEPAAVQTWDSCIYSASEEAEFAVNFLWPALKKNNLAHVKINVWDHNKEIIFTEGCVEYSRFASDNQISHAEMYAHDMISDFNAGANAFIDWNIYLDSKGGPNHVGNFCDAPIMCDVEKDEVDVKLSYYYIGHMSRFVKPDAKRILVSKYSGAIESVGFVNPDGEKVVVVLNRTDDDKAFTLFDGTNSYDYNMKAHSIATFCW